VNDVPAAAPVTRAAGRPGLYVGPVHVTAALVVVAVILVGSVAYIGYVVTSVRDGQIPMLAVGFVGLGVAFVAIAAGSLIGMWRAASRSEGGRALLLAIVGGLAGLAAIGAFTVTALSMLVWNT